MLTFATAIASFLNGVGYRSASGSPTVSSACFLSSWRTEETVFSKHFLRNCKKSPQMSSRCAGRLFAIFVDLNFQTPARGFTGIVEGIVGCKE
jgi:hypothetical protein